MKDIPSRQKFLLGFLFVMIIYYLVDSGVLSFSGAKDKVEEVSTEDQDGEEAINGIDIDQIKLFIAASRNKKINYEGTWTKDPFFYLENDTFKTVNNTITQDIINEIKFTLTGISWQGNYGFALIGDEIVQENDVIDGYIVEKVASDYVILSNGESTIKLTLKE